MASANFRILTKRLADAYFTGTYKAMIVTALPDETALDTWDFRDDVTNECADGDYTAGGYACTMTVSSVDTTNNRVGVTAACTNPVATSATISGVGVVIYKVVGSAATDEVVAVVDWGGTRSSSAGDFNITFSAPLYITTS